MPIEPRDYKVLGGCNGCGSATPFDREPRETLNQVRQTQPNQDPTDKPLAGKTEQWRLDAPSRQQVGNPSGDSPRSDEEEEERPDNCSDSTGQVDPRSSRMLVTPEGPALVRVRCERGLLELVVDLHEEILGTLRVASQVELVGVLRRDDLVPRPYVGPRSRSPVPRVPRLSSCSTQNRHRVDTTPCADDSYRAKLLVELVELMGIEPMTS